MLWECCFIELLKVWTHFMDSFSLQVCRAFKQKSKHLRFVSTPRTGTLYFPTLQKMFKILLCQSTFFYHDSSLLVQIPHMYLDINTWPDVFPYAKKGIWLVQNTISNNCGEHILIFSLLNQIKVKYWSILVHLPSRDPLLMEIRIWKILKKNIKQYREKTWWNQSTTHFTLLAKGHQPKNVKNRKELNDYTANLKKTSCRISGKLQVTITYRENFKLRFYSISPKASWTKH